MALVELNWRSSSRDLRLFAVAQFVLAAQLIWMASRGTGWTTFTACLLAASGLGAIIGLYSPQAVRPVYVVWMLLTFPIGWVLSHLVLALVYYGVVTPIGLILRICGRDSLQLRQNPTATTYWNERNQPSDPARYFRQF